MTNFSKFNELKIKWIKETSDISSMIDIVENQYYQKIIIVIYKEDII